MTNNKQPDNVLLIDDDQFIRDIYSKKFSESGVKLVTAKNGREALDILEENDFGVLLVDIIMPELDGMEFLEEFYSQKDSDNTDVIVLTNQGQPEDIDKAKEFDIDGYVIKANNVPSEILEEVIRIYNQ